MRRLAALRCTRKLPSVLQELEQTIAICNFLRGVKTQASEVLDIDGSLFSVVKATHATGRGRQLGNVQMELRALKSGAKRTLRHRPYDTLELAQLQSKTYQYMYAEGEEVHLMDMERFDQISVAKALFGDQSRWLADGLEVSITLTTDGEPVTGSVPQMVTLRVTDAPPTSKGDRVSPVTKPCTLEGGAVVTTPGFVESGQRIIVDTRSGTFIKRVT